MDRVIRHLATVSIITAMLVSGAVGSRTFAAKDDAKAKNRSGAKAKANRKKQAAKNTQKTSSKTTVAKATTSAKPKYTTKGPKLSKKFSIAKTMIQAKKIDQLVQADYKRNKAAPMPRTSDVDFLRRVYLDLVGRIPTYDESIGFLESRKPSKRAELVDYLLRSPGYNSTMFNFWADILRLQSRNRNDPTGNYSKWVKESIAQNKPYDKFVFEMLTAEGRTRDDGAAGYFLRDSGMPLDNASLTAQIFLGTQIGCAQCHDHPFDKWTQMDFYQFASYTGQVKTRGQFMGKSMGSNSRQMRSSYAKIRQQANQLPANERQMFQLLVRTNSYRVSDSYKSLKLPDNYEYDDGKPGQMVKPKVIFGADPAPKDRSDLRESFARWLTSKENPRFATVIANRLWKKVMGIGVVEPIDDFSDSNKPMNPELMDYLTKLMVEVKFDTKQYLRVLCNTRVYQLSASRNELTPENYHAQGAVLRRMTAEQVWDSLLSIAVSKVDTREGLQATFGRYGALGSIDVDKLSPDQLIETAKKMAADRKNRGKSMMSSNNPNAAKIREEMIKRRRQFAPQYTRASEMQSPMQPGTFLAQFGQARRNAPNDGHSDPTVPQALAMMNGPITALLTNSRSQLVQNMSEFQEPKDRINVLWISILSRKPSTGEMRMASDEIRQNGKQGYTNLVWALVNSREFMFVK
jgi:hypothetical protein